MEVKPATTYGEQLLLLKSRGCIIDDGEFCEKVLQQINYYRLSAYFIPFRKDDGSYQPGTSFRRVYRIYEFDRKMRRVLFSAVEQVELYLRTQLAYYHAHKYGALGYMNADNFGSNYDNRRFEELFKSEVEHSKNIPFVRHHIEKYEGDFPVWVATELFSFGMLSFFYRGMKTSDKKEIAKTAFNTTYRNLDSWLRCCTDLRNICAHYGRLYYRTFTAIPATPSNLPVKLNRRLFDNIMMLKFLYPDHTRWNYEVVPALAALMEEYEEDINLSHIGFPFGWESLLKG